MVNEQKTDGYQFFEHSYNRAVIKGKWKAISKIGSDVWQLYNLEADCTELHDVSTQYSDVLNDLAARWEDWAVRCKALPKGQRTVMISG